MTVALSIVDLFDILAEALDNVPEYQRGETLSKVCSVLKQKNVSDDDLEKGKKYLLLREDFKHGFIDRQGLIKRKEIIATRNVPINKSEEIGENGLFWRDLRK
jgi:hypothetical protein